MLRKHLGRATILVGLVFLFIACTSNPPANSCRQTSDCSKGLECTDSKCQIPPGNQPCAAETPTRCNDTCVNTRNDTQHCGYCNNRCASQERCKDGRCVGDTEPTPPDSGPADPGCKDPTPTRCGSSCVNTRNDDQHCGFCGNVCQAGASCQNGSCETGTITCPQGQLLCQNTCVVPKNNPAHCGACDNKCAGDELCSAGICIKRGGGSACSDRSLTQCGAACVNLNADNQHCGTCGNACKTPQVCAGGTCSCPAGFAICGGACVDLLIDAAHCGVCGNKCSANELCASGRCLTPCPRSTPDICNGACVDLQSQFQHCGKCGTTCQSGQRCIKGACQCVGGLTTCSGNCVDLRSDSQHCGKCGTACNQGQLCSQGNCITNCPPSTPNVCFGGCVDTRTNSQHCGGCGNQCKGGTVCLQGTCRCPSGFQLCNGQCTDTKNNAVHCGKCGNKCQAGSFCSEGRCRTSCPLQTPLSCYGGCVDPDVNIQHCGGCGNACPIGGTCDKGTCTCPNNRKSCAGLCVDTEQDRLNCGTCGNVCPSDEVCILGACSKCTSSLTKCGGTCCPEAQACCGKSCHDLQTDRENCGACGNKCGQGLSCCGGQCVDLKADLSNCGACGFTCANDHRCDTALCIWQGSVPETPPTSAPFSKTITATAISFNSLYYAVALSDFTIILWNIETDKQVALLRGHTKTIKTLAFSYDQKWLASGGEDNTVKLWQLSNNKLASTFTAHKGAVNDIAWSPGSERLISASSDTTAMIWLRNTSLVLHTLKHAGGVLEVDWTRNGRYIATSSDDKKMALWNATNGQQLIANLNPFIYFTRTPRRLVNFSPDGDYLFATDGGSTIGIWLIPNGDFIRFGLKNGDKVHAANWSPDSKKILYSEQGKSSSTIRLTDFVQFTRSIIHKTISIPKTAKWLNWSADGRVILYTQDNEVKLIKGPRGCAPSKLLRTINLSTTSIRDIAWSPDNKRIAVAVDGKIQIVDTETGKTEKTYNPDSNRANAVDWSSNGNYILSGGSKAQLWNVTTDKVDTQIHGTHSGSNISDILFTQNNIDAVSIGAATTLALFNVLSNGTLRASRVWGRHDVSPSHLAIHPNSQSLAVPHNKKIRLWNIQQARYLGDITLPDRSRGRIDYSPDGKFIASALNDGSLRFWSTASQREIRVLKGYAAPLNHADFHPERPLIATSDNNKEILYIDTDTDKTIATLKGHQNNIRYILFNRIGSRLASASDKGKLRIWGCP